MNNTQRKSKKSTRILDSESVNRYQTDEANEANIVAEPVGLYGYPINNIAKGINSMIGSNLHLDFHNIKNDNELISVIRQGVPKEAMSYFMNYAGISLMEMASITHTSDRTLRRYKPKDKLPQEQSERMIELAKLYELGVEVFGSIGNFKSWMESSLVTFGNNKPKDYLDTSLGIRLLTDEIGRIRHGIFA